MTSPGCQRSWENMSLFCHTWMRFEMWGQGDDSGVTCWLRKPVDSSSGLRLPLWSWEQGQASIAIAKARRDGRLPGAHCLTSLTELTKVQRQILSHRCGGERSRKTFKLSSGFHVRVHAHRCMHNCVNMLQRPHPHTCTRMQNLKASYKRRFY